ncbi:hypothetical protein ONZ45_g11843 [Pleurotus djamor]|nr:hypothetical protein ONZ45_g11843 [Pleurotus djamor]
MPGLRAPEDANPPRLPKPTTEDTKPDLHTALFDCPHRALLPGGRKRRNLIVNLDGTSNQFSVNSTNVVEIFSRIIKSGGDIEQLVYYNSGIGTYARPSFRSFSYLKQVLYNLIDTAIAWNFERIVYAAYKWLSENYEPGDRIFLFGFSRGAYQVRVIAGMIERSLADTYHWIVSAYELYTAATAHSKRGSTQTDGEARGTSESNNKRPTFNSEEDELCWSFKKSLCHKDVKVHFVGAWDTVSSIGVFRGKSLPETVSGMGHVCHFRHALALDERRAKFQPEYVNGGFGPIKGEPRGDVKEVWFKGTHSDIGGGNVRNKYLENFSDSLRWMTYEAQFCGLLIEPYTGNWVAVIPKESLTGVWMLLEIIPFGALSYKDQDSLTWWPHLGEPRKIQPGQLIHQSVFGTLPNRSEAEDETTSQSDPNFSDEDDESPLEAVFKASSPETHLALDEVVDESDASHRMPGSFIVAKIPEAAEYFPKAVLHESLGIPNWPTFFSQYSQGKDLPIIEQDPFENATHILSTLSQACDALESAQGDQGSALNTLSVGIQTLQSFVDDPTRLSSLLEVPDAHNILMKAITVVVRDTAITLSRESKETLVRLFARAWRPGPWMQIATTTVPRPSPSQVSQWGLELQKTHRDDLLKVIRPFAFITEQPVEHVHDVAFLGADPSRILFTTHCKTDEPFEVASIWEGSTHPAKEIVRSARDGREVSIINTTTKPPLVTKATDKEEPIDSGNIMSWCFSDDCQTLASTHENGCIKLWRQEEDQWKVFKRFKGGDGQIWFSAFSRDGTKLVFDTEPIKVWSLADDSLMELEDSQDTRSLAWSPSGDWVVAGTMDGEVKIWSPDRGKIEHTCKAHDDAIGCLAFRHDGQVLATGSHDKRIRIWRCHTWEKIWEFDVGRTIRSLAFSPDGKRLVSGIWDGLHLWDVDTGDIGDTT